MDAVEESFRSALSNFVSLESLESSAPKIVDIRPLAELLTQELDQSLVEIVDEAIYCLAQEAHNLSICIDHDLLSLVLDGLANGSPTRLKLVRRLIEGGCSPTSSRRIFKELSTSRAGAPIHEIVDHALVHTLPPHFEFDTSALGHASITFPTLPRIFPPLHGGYSFFSWLFIDQVDSGMHITLFGVFDTTQKSFTMAYLEKDSQCVILQTSLTSSVRFKYHFRTKVWYNIAVTHRRPKQTGSARATLYVDGVEIETLKIAYPANCPTSSSMQGFLGSIRDFAPGGSANVKYRLGQTILAAQVLSSELIRQYYKLGSAYTGNYQDYLASYLTYEASSDLKILNEQSSATDLLASRNSNNMPESCLIMSIAGEIHRTGFPSLALGRDAREYMLRLSSAGSQQIVLNKAVADISSVSSLHKAMGNISGGITSLRPIPLASNVYKIGGAGVLLYLVECARDKETLVKNLKICLSAVSKSYVNSEEFEKMHAYEILAKILKEKDRELICSEVLATILDFIGLEREFLTNPMAYRFLVADFDIWSRASEDVQRNHLNQFLIFSNSSAFGAFNNARLARMHILRKFLARIRLGVTESMLPQYIIAMRCLLTNDFSTENVRNISSFVIYMLRRKKHKTRLSVSLSSTHSWGISPLDTKQNGGLAVLHMLEDVLCECAGGATILLDKFAYTITNRWVLLLMSLAHTRIPAMRILACLLISQGRSYIRKFGGKNEGFVVCEALLEKTTENFWIELLAITFSLKTMEFRDTVERVTISQFVDFAKGSNATLEIVNPEIMPTLLTMLRWRALKAARIDAPRSVKPHANDTALGHARKTSLSTVMGQAMQDDAFDAAELETEATLLTDLIRCLRDIHAASPSFRLLCDTPDVRDNLMNMLFFLTCDTDSIDPTVELQTEILLGVVSGRSRQSTVSSSACEENIETTCKSAASETSFDTIKQRFPALRRGSSFVLLSESDTRPPKVPVFNHERRASHRTYRKYRTLQPLINALWGFLIEIGVYGIFESDELRLSEFRCLPAASTDDQVSFWSRYQLVLLTAVSDQLQSKYNQLTRSKSLDNFARYIQSAFHDVVDGLFLGGQEQLFRTIANAVEQSRLLQSADGLAGKNNDSASTTLRQTLQKVRNCSYAFVPRRANHFQLTLLRLSDLSRQDFEGEEVYLRETTSILNHLLYYQQFFFQLEDDLNFLKRMSYLLYSLTSNDNARDIQLLTLDVWRAILLLRRDEFNKMLLEAKEPNLRVARAVWDELSASDSETFLLWLDEHRASLDSFFLHDLLVSWSGYVKTELRASGERVNNRVKGRKEKLKSQVVKDARAHEVIGRYETTSSSWYDNVVSVESNKARRFQQDSVDDRDYVSGQWNIVRVDLTTVVGIFGKKVQQQWWRLDPTECALRQRRKIRPSLAPAVIQSRGSSPSPETVNAQVSESQDQDYELVEPPISNATNSEEEQDVDRNRKVIRSLDVGDHVLEVGNVFMLFVVELTVQVYNISRITGLHAVEGLLILGRLKFYLIDNYFNRADGEICDLKDPSIVRQRDPILQVLAGQEAGLDARKTAGRLSNTPHECRSFSYESCINASKRQFLFRDVALELFFSDGRNYLITTLNKQRDFIHKKILDRTNFGSDEELSRKDTVATLSTFGAKLMNVFNLSPAAQAASRWERRDITNFEYLMIINSLAGRSYNDLTQYPIMPWILGDLAYSSTVLDLKNPATFRDLTKNMGSQHSERRRDFQERYESFAAAGIDDTKPFHFGTHYSSAMIVCSYLIRLVPFVESYLLLQGGHFDHPDRLFYSVKKAWFSASRDNMTDVRELTPEWFYLPEFLVNRNGFDFGHLQTTGEKINDVELPPWAHNDPEVFIAKHREALESDFVSANLHHWIDLTFGHKQLGSAAVEAVNVYHALSYHGAIDLDTVKDPVERLATIGIIHNFGQTPRQVFNKPHVSRGQTSRSKLSTAHLRRMCLQAGSWDIRHPVGEISVKDGIMGSPIGRVKSSLNSEISIIWGTSDNSVRILSTEGISLGNFPSLHDQKITHCLSIASSLILGSEDSTISVLRLAAHKKDQIQLQSQVYLRGHTTTITALAASADYSIVVSGEEAGSVLVFDFNRLEFVRKLCTFDVPVRALAVNASTGFIIACSTTCIRIFTVNGRLLIDLDLDSDLDIEEEITSAASFSSDIILTGHNNGLALVWKMTLDDSHTVDADHSPWCLNLISRLSCRTTASITAFKMSQSRIFTGDTNGKIHSWAVGT